MISQPNVNITTHDSDILDETEPIVRTSDPYLCNPLDVVYSAVTGNDVGRLKRLISYKFDVNDRDPNDFYGCTPLSQAVNLRNLEMVTLLLEANANMLLSDTFEFGHNALYRVFEIEESAREPFVKCFVRQMMKVDRIERVVEALLETRCSLTDVVRYGDANLTEAYLEKNCDVSSSESESSINVVIDRVDVDNARVLLQCGAKVDDRKLYFCQNMYWLTCNANFKNLRAAHTFAEFMVRWGVVIKSAIPKLARIFEEGDNEVVEMFLRHEIDIHIRDSFGVHVLANMFGNNNVDAISLLENRVYSVDMRSCREQTPLHFAVSKALTDKVKFLLNRGANPNAMDDNCETPLIRIMDITNDWGVSTKIAKLLLQHEADGLVVQNEGLTFVDNVINTLDAKGLRKIAVAHVAIVEAAGEKIDESISESIDVHPELKSYYKVCLEQLVELKSRKIREKLTIFSLVSNKAEKLCGFVTDNDRKVIKKFMGNRGKKLEPVYRSLIVQKLKRMREMKVCREKAVKVLSQSFDVFKTNYYILKEIVSYFSYADLLILK